MEATAAKLTRRNQKSHTKDIQQTQHMKILVGNIPLPANRFLVDLNDGLAIRNDVTHDHDMFWNMKGEFDVLHLHFPEYMTFEIQHAYQNELTTDLMQQIETRLKFWSERCPIAVTRHVLLPHTATSDPKWEQLYEMVYRYSSGVIHFAQPSIDEFQERYANTDFVNGPPLHALVPHQNYATLPNTVSREDAREALGIPQDAQVMLAFGQVRNDAERQLVLDTFRNMSTRKKVLVSSRWREKLANVSWIRLKYWIRDLTRLYYRLHPGYRFNYGFVEEEDTQLYLNAADVLFIPRLKVLNSGNITLGMTFGKVVVGPDVLDVGHLLKETNNVVFDYNNPSTAAAAMDIAMQLASEGQIGRANRELALNEWSAEQCADQYIDFFAELRSQKLTVREN
jgi:glycosyltransferase involved in cell wall biosynthesis